jgi:hypothetical protein
MLRTGQFVLGFALLIATVVDSEGQSQRGSSRSQPPSAQVTQQPAPDQRGTEQSPLSVKIVPPEGADKKAAEEKHEREEKAKIDEKLAFETQRIADYTIWLSLITLGMACVTGYLAYATWVAARAAKMAAEHIPRLERAYIYGGFGPQHGGRRHRLEPDLSETILAAVTMANYGKTPGFVTTIKVGTCKLSELPDEPVYQEEFVISDLYFPGMTTAEVRQTRAEAKIPADGEHVVFQRVFYTDVLGNEHYSGSIYLLFAVPLREGIHIFDEPVRPGSAYWATDDNPSQKS